MKLDGTDLKILDALQHDARISNQDLARQVGLSPTPCLRRSNRLQQSGLVRGHAALLDQAALGWKVNAFVFVSLEQQNNDALEAFVGRIAGHPRIMECYLMTGDSDYLLRVVARDLDDYQRFLLSTITPIPGVANIRTSFALQQVAYKTALPLDEPDPE